MSDRELHQARERFDEVVAPNAGLGRIDPDDDAATEFCECGAVLEDCCEPPSCCLCAQADEDERDSGVDTVQPA